MSRTTNLSGKMKLRGVLAACALICLGGASYAQSVSTVASESADENSFTSTREITGAMTDELFTGPDANRRNARDAQYRHPTETCTFSMNSLCQHDAGAFNRDILGSSYDFGGSGSSLSGSLR